MDSLPAEDRLYVDEPYVAYGLFDRDPVHQPALVRMLDGREPQVIAAQDLYQRSSKSQWFEGKPAMKWTAAAAKDPDHDARVEVVVGWMHSELISQFTTYSMEFDGERWQVLSVDLFDPEAPLDLPGEGV